jgi:hypothetical protein
MMGKQSPETTEIVYADCSGELIFLPKNLALELAQIWTALNNSKTWGEFQANVPDHVYEEIMAEMKDDEDPEALPDPENAFDSDAIPGYDDGDWPTWPLQYMLEWMPEDIQQQYGKVVPSAVNGDCLELLEEKAGEIVLALEKRGYTCTEDESLVIRACGYF